MYTIDPEYFEKFYDEPRKEDQPIGIKFYLGNPDFHFEYRYDRNNRSLKRAELYHNGQSVESIAVSAGWGIPDRNHHQVINELEVLSLKY